MLCIQPIISRFMIIYARVRVYDGVRGGLDLVHDRQIIRKYPTKRGGADVSG